MHIMVHPWRILYLWHKRTCQIYKKNIKSNGYMQRLRITGIPITNGVVDKNVDKSPWFAVKKTYRTFYLTYYFTIAMELF